MTTRNLPRLTDQPGAAAGSSSVQQADVGLSINSRYSLRDFLTLLFRDWKVLLLTFLAVVLLATVVSFIPSVKYTANSRLLVMLSREYVFRPEIGEAGAGIALGQPQIVKSEIEILSSAGLKERVIETIGLARIYPEVAGEAAATPEAQRARMNSAIERFEKAMTIEPVKDSNVLRVTYTHKDPEVAAEALNLLLRFFLEHRREVYSQHGSEFLLSQRDEFATRLADARSALEAFKAVHGITDLEQQQAQLLRQRGDLESSLLETSSRLDQSEAQLANLRASMRDVPRSVPLYSESAAPQALDSARARLLELELRRSELLTKYAPTSRFVADVDQQIAQARSFLDREQARRGETQRVGSNPVFEELQTEAIKLEAERESLRARRESLVQQIDAISGRQAELERLGQEYRTLTLQQQILQQQYQAYADKAEEARILDDLDNRQSANIRIIERATPPTEGRNLQPLIILGGIFFGLFAALLVGLAREFSRATMVTPEGVERALGLPVLVSVPHREPAGQGRAAERGRLSGAAPAPRPAGLFRRLRPEP